MPIPIRLVNNADGNLRIENTFQNPPVAGPKATIALKSCNVRFTKDVYNQDYEVTADNRSVQLTINGGTTTVLLDVGTYNRQEFIQMLSQVMNEYFGQGSINGLDIDCEVTDNGKFKLEVSSSPLSQQDTQSEWTAPTGSWTLAGDNFSFNSSTPLSIDGRFVSRVTAPRNSGQITFDITGYGSGATENIYFGLLDVAESTKTFTEADFLIGGGVQGLDIVTIENGVVSTTGNTLSSATLEVNMNYLNGVLTVEIDGNAEVADAPDRIGHYRWAVYIPDNGFDFDCENLEAQTTDQTTQTSFELDVANTTLQKYLGLGGDKLTGSGNPAAAIGDKVMEGDSETADVIVRLDAPTLVGFDGLSGRKASILEVIPQFQQTGNNSLYVPNELTLVPMDNAAAFNLSKMTITFVRQQGNRPLQIDKGSCVYLLLYNSDELNY